jgi:hypothetical protein
MVAMPPEREGPAMETAWEDPRRRGWLLATMRRIERDRTFRRGGSPLMVGPERHAPESA